MPGTAAAAGGFKSHLNFPGDRRAAGPGPAPGAAGAEPQRAAGGTAGSPVDSVINILNAGHLNQRWLILAKLHPSPLNPSQVLDESLCPGLPAGNLKSDYGRFPSQHYCNLFFLLTDALF